MHLICQANPALATLQLVATALLCRRDRRCGSRLAELAARRRPVQVVSYPADPPGLEPLENARLRVRYDYLTLVGSE